MAPIPTSPSSTTPPVSTSRIGTERRRLTVRPKPGDPLTAYYVAEARIIVLPSGDEVYARIGDWVLSRNGIAVDVMPDDVFHHRFESAEEHGLLVAGPVRAEIERLIGIGTTDTPEHLCTAIGRLARLKVGNVEIDFTPGQWELLAHKAEKRGISVRSLLKQVVDRITSEIWNYA